MRNVMVTGAGKIGSVIACMLAQHKDYRVHLIDMEFIGSDVTRMMEVIPKINAVTLDVKDQTLMHDYITKNKIVAVISSLPYFLNSYVAQAAKSASAHYFDLTEDTSITAVVKAIATDATTAFVPQCGLAPGFVNIVANSLMQSFDECHYAKLRVGAIPQQASNALQYALTWSTDGVINEYGNLCHAIEGGLPVSLAPLEGLETLAFNGCEYEAFNTSGGLGSLAEIYTNRIINLNYKTIRYPGHCEKMRFLMNDLKLNDDRETLKRILERALAKTYQDVVLIYVSVEGIKQGERIETSYFKKIYPTEICGLSWSAIQVSTASGICSIVDLLLKDKIQQHGIVLQEHFSLKDVLDNRFGICFR